MLRNRRILVGNRPLTAASFSLVIGVLSPGLCMAQCVEHSERVPQINVETFAMEPTSLLRQLRNDKDKLVGRLTGYLVTSPSLLPSVQKLIYAGRTDERVAIGRALRRAELRCISSNQELARKINNFVRKVGDLAVLSGYSAEADDAPASAPSFKPPGSSRGLMSGDWKTDLADPFAGMPLPE
jgi:hypothetical protein